MAVELMEDILKTITVAEAKAAQIKEAALLRAQEITAEAEKRAGQLREYSETSLKAYRETELKKAVEKAQKDYDGEIAKEREKAVKYADGLLKNTDFYVNDIVGRISGGSR